MKMTSLIIILIAALSLTIVGCSSSRESASTDTASAQPTIAEGRHDLKLYRDDNRQPIGGLRHVSVMPKAIVYKTSGDYSNNVSVTVSESGELLSFPAPTDIPTDATPVRLSSGWLISKVGISQNSVFTTFTFDEYRQLKRLPAPEEILNAIIPDSRVTATMPIPLTLEEALANPEKAESYLSIKLRE